MSNLSEVIFRGGKSAESGDWGSGDIDIAIPSWATKVVADTWTDGGANSAANFVVMRFNRSTTASSYNRARRGYAPSAYAYSAVSADRFFGHTLDTGEEDGFTRFVFYPKKEAAVYTQGMAYSFNASTSSVNTYYNRWLNTADPVTSVQFFLNTSSTTGSFRLLVRAYR